MRHKTIFKSEDNINIREYKPGDLGYIAYMHCRIYEREYGLDSSSFELYVLPNMAKFLENPDKGGSNVWVAEINNQIVGAIAIIKVDKGSAQLRWFLVDPDFRGLGLGKKLMTAAVHFCEHIGHKKVFLWTIDFLDAARHLYSKFDFQLGRTKTHFIWGKTLTEEYWELNLNPR